MEIKEFIVQQKALGISLHFNDGVWWEEQKGLYCKPAFKYQKITPGSTRPKKNRAILGYRHIVKEGDEYNSQYSVMGMNWKRGVLYNIDNLSSKRRSKVRRGQKRSEICKIDNIEPHLEQIRSIVVSAKERTGAGKPTKYYYDNYRAWCKEMIALSEMDDRFWWGAFYEGKLIAYYHTTYIEGVVIINAAKSHSDFLKYYPNDALLYSVILHSINDLKCDFIEYGEWSPEDDNLTYFKESYGFEKKDFKQYRKINPLLSGVYNVIKRQAILIKNG